MRLRLPLGWLSSILFVLFLAGACILWDLREVSREYSTWRSDPQLSYLMQTISRSLVIGSGLLLSVCIIIEIALKSGWEPARMRKLLAGVVVQRKFYRYANIGSDRLYILVRQANGHEEEFECDLDEYEGIEEGDCLSLYVIGPYVASYRKLPEERAESLRSRAGLWGRDREITPYLLAYGTAPLNLKTWLMVLAGYLFTGWFLALGITFSVTGEIYMRTKTRRFSSRYYETFINEDWVPKAGIAIIIGVAILFFLIVWLFRKGITNQESGYRDSIFE